MFESQKGLTLVELLVVTAIIMILSAVTIPNWNKGGDQLKVTRAAYQIHQGIRRAQELTLASADCDQCSCPTQHGYGIHFAEGNNSYDLFGECDSFDNNGNLSELYDSSSERKVKVHLEENVEIKEIFKKTPGGWDSSISKLIINYRPPDPKVLIRDGNGNTLEGGKIELKSGVYCQEVETNRFGLIEIKEVNKCP